MHEKHSIRAVFSGCSLQAQWTHMNAGAHTQGHILLYYIIAYYMQQNCGISSIQYQR